MHKRFFTISIVFMLFFMALQTCAATRFPMISTDELQMCVTRAEFSHQLANLLQEKGVPEPKKEIQNFTDVETEYLYYNDILFLKKLGVVNGDGTGAFHPEALLLQQEAIAMLCRTFRADQYIQSECGVYPQGYMMYALREGLCNGITVNAESPLTSDCMLILFTNVKEKIKIHDLSISTEYLGCDVRFNGHVYVDYYPKHWEGVSEIPTSTLNGYFNILPEKILISYDKVTWITACETLNGKYTTYDLPEFLAGSKINWSENAFLCYTADGKPYHSYDYKNWYSGKPLARTYSDPVPVLSEYGFPYGIEPQNIYKLDDSPLYYSFYSYVDSQYFSQTYSIILNRPKVDIVWVSEDLVDWHGIEIPNLMLSCRRVLMDKDTKALLYLGENAFSAEENVYLDREEETAASLRKMYDRPAYKLEHYMLPYREIEKIFEK